MFACPNYIPKRFLLVTIILHRVADPKKKMVPRNSLVGALGTQD